MAAVHATDLKRAIALKAVTRACILAALGLISGGESRAEKGMVIKTHFFFDNEGLLVQTPVVRWITDLSSDMEFSIQFRVDRVNIPPARSIAGIPKPVDAVTGASRPASAGKENVYYIKSRNEAVASLSMKNLTLGAYYSVENDYRARLISVGISHEWNQKNTNLAAKLSYGWDDITPLNRQETFDKRNVMATLVLTQSLSPTAIMRMGIDASYVTGFQSNPYRSAFVGGEHRLEVHPPKRKRFAFFIKLNRYLLPARASLWTDYRFYVDDWKIRSHTLELKYYQYVSKALYIRYRYRYYRQSAAWFYRKIYPADSEYFTADFKLIGFTAHLFGFRMGLALEKLSRKLRLPLLQHSRLEFKYERYFTSEKYAANIMEIGVRFSR